MENKKRILIVDDDFEIALFLRTTMQVIWPDVEVVNVPSGEEGVLEVRRSKVDLIIADLKLPGIHGLEFISQIERLAPKTPIIVITGERSPELHERVRSLNVAGFFLKPLQVEDITKAISKVLNGDPAAKPVVSELSPQFVRRLSALRIDTGAQYVMLVDLHGNCRANDGQVSDVDTGRIAALLAQELASSLELAKALKAPQPFTINYQAGAVHDLYAANVGPGHLVALIFDAQRGRGQIGAVWVYARRAVKEMLGMLNEAPAAPLPPRPEPRRELPKAPPKRVEPPAAPAPAPAQLKQIDLSFSENEVDAFWDSVLDEGGNGGFSGISLEEARAKGLIPSDFGSTS